MAGSFIFAADRLGMLEQVSGAGPYYSNWPTPQRASTVGHRAEPPRGPAGDQPAAAYDPCRYLHYVLNPEGSIPGGDQLIRQAVAETATATGLGFIRDGETKERPSDGRQPLQPERYGDRWAPVLIAWSSPDETPPLAGAVLGTAGSLPVSLPGGPEILVTGQLVLDAPQLEGMLEDPGGADLVRAVIMHELGHIVGLDHVDDPAMLMHPLLSPAVTEFAETEQSLLAAQGQGPCAPGI